MAAWPAEFRRRCHGQEATLLDDGHGIAHFGQFGENVRADQNRFAFRSELTDHFAQLNACPRIESGSRLVHDQDGRIVNDGPAQAQSLFHAFGKPVDRFLGQAIELGKAHYATESALPLGPHQAVSPGKEIEILTDQDAGLRIEIVGHEAQTAPHAVGILRDGKTIDKSVAPRGHIQRGQNAHAGGLAGAVGTDVSKHMAAAHGKADILHRLGRAKIAMQVCQLDKRVTVDHGCITYHLPRMTCRPWLSVGLPKPASISVGRSTMAT